MPGCRQSTTKIPRRSTHPLALIGRRVRGSRRPIVPAGRRAVGAETIQDGFVSRLVRHQDLVPVRQGVGRSLELVGGHPGVGAAAYEDLPQGDRFVDTQVGLDVLLHHPDDLGHLRDGVPPEGLAPQGGYQLLLALYAVEVSASCAAIARVQEGVAAVQVLESIPHPPPGWELVLHVHLDPTHGVHDLTKALEIDYRVVVYRDFGVVLQRADGLLDPAVEVGGVDPILHPRLYLYQEVPGHREQLDLPRTGNEAHEHYGVGPGPVDLLLLAIGRPLVHTQD